MCGILGIISNSGFDHPQWNNFITGLDSMKMRGPDDWGWALFNSNSRVKSKEKYLSFTGKKRLCPENIQSSNAILGHRRLSIIDLSENGHQPMASEDRRIWITYNGEVYNYVELRNELQSRGYLFSTKTDTEVILASYAQWGDRCFEKFNGMWGIALLDLNREILLLSRDRFGIKPLYYGKTEKSLCFASTINALLTVINQERRTRDDVVYKFLIDGYQPSGEDTFFQNVLQVRPGSTLKFSLRDALRMPKTDRWWNPTPMNIPERDALDALQNILTDAVRIRLRSDVPVGSCLSGGLDSTNIVEIMASLLKQVGMRVHTITSCYDDKEFDERNFAELISNQVSSIPEWIYPSGESLTNDLFDLALIQEEPFNSLSIYSQFCVMRGAKKAGLTVLLDGQGGDEIFLGYDSCLVTRLLLMIKQCRFIDSFREICYLNRHKTKRSLLWMFILLAYSGFPNFGLQLKKSRTASFFNPDFIEKNETSFGIIRPVENFSDMRHRLIEEKPLPVLLRYEDRNSMAHSVETRLPFLDYRIVNFAFGLNDRLVSSEGWSKYILRLNLRNNAPDEVVWRKDKKGFPTPSAKLINELGPFLKDIFKNNPRTRRFLNNSKSFHSILSNGNFELYWRIISTELWMRTMNVF